MLIEPETCRSLAVGCCVDKLIVVHGDTARPHCVKGLEDGRSVSQEHAGRNVFRLFHAVAPVWVKCVEDCVKGVLVKIEACNRPHRVATASLAESHSDTCLALHVYFQQVHYRDQREEGMAHMAS